MTDIEKILVATDFSRSAANAVRRAVDLARAAGARLELLHVLPREQIPASWTAVRSVLGFDPVRVKDDAMDRLRQAAGQVDAEHGLAVEIRLAEGRAHAEIAARAGALGADLVVVGAHGEHFVADMFIGTTAQRVQRLSTVPVLVVRQASFYRYERVLVATDFSPTSAQAARVASRFFPHARFDLLHVFEAPFEGRLGLGGLEDAAIEDYRRQVGDQALREFETFIRDAGLEGRTASIRVRHGYAPARIKERAAELDADLVVLGTQGKSWLAMGILGSVSEHVAAESSADVLLVRPAA